MTPVTFPVDFGCDQALRNALPDAPFGYDVECLANGAHWVVQLYETHKNETIRGALAIKGQWSSLPVRIRPVVDSRATVSNLDF